MIAVVTFAFVVFLVIHALIHVMGFAKAFGYADLPGLTVPISPAMGVIWQLAACLLFGAACAVYGWPRIWWLLGMLGVVVSMIAIVPSWTAAKAGALANLVVLIGVVFGALTYGPTSLRAAYERDRSVALAARPPLGIATVTADDLVRLPEPIRRYLHACGAVGHSRVLSVAARMHGRIRSAPDAPWMPFAAEQVDVFGARPTRMFYLTATRALVPIQGYHRFFGSAASMRIVAAGLWPVSTLSGEELSTSETVTLFNDIAILAPSALLAPEVTWGAVSSRTDGAHAVQARFTRAGRVVSAELVIGADGALLDFVSDDRSATEPDGQTMTRRRWSTPMRDVRSFGQIRLASKGEGRWHDGQQSWSYLEVTIDDVRYDVGR